MYFNLVTLQGVDPKDARIFYVEKLIAQDSHHEALAIMKEHLDEAFEMTERMLLSAEISMSRNTSDLEPMMLFLGSALIHVRKMQKNDLIEDLEARYQDLKNKVVLRNIYGITGKVTKSSIISFIDKALEEEEQTIRVVFVKLLKISELSGRISKMVKN